MARQRPKRPDALPSAVARQARTRPGGSHGRRPSSRREERDEAILEQVIDAVLAEPLPFPEYHRCLECPEGECTRACPVCQCHRPYCGCV